jgi:hypothetical protein
MAMKEIDNLVSLKNLLEFVTIILDSPQSGPFLPVNGTIDHSNAINVRRHIYSPSQLPQGLTEGQLVMLLQKGHQYPLAGQPFPAQQEPQVIEYFPGQRIRQRIRSDPTS